MQKKILIVEDGEFNRDLLIQLLSDDYEIVVAADGEEGVKKAFRENPDLILMDLGLPVLDGWEATKRIKAESELKHIPVIAITSRAMVGDERKARAVGCDDYLAKPIDEDQLIERIKKLI
jgi:two-component system cell cycle response regulator DivK